MAPWPDGAFLGRGDLLRELTAAADGARRGTGSVVLLTGEAGIGKTSVVRTLARQVRDDLAVSWGTCIGFAPTTRRSWARWSTPGAGIGCCRTPPT